MEKPDDTDPPAENADMSTLAARGEAARRRARAAQVRADASSRRFETLSAKIDWLTSGHRKP